MNKYIKIGIIAAAICVCFIIGWWIGKLTIYKSPIEQEPVTLTENVFTTDLDETISPEPEKQVKVTYSIISDDENIYLYEITDDNESVIASKNIEIELLPSSDREKLSDGITTDSYSEALKIWEGYVS